MRLVSMLIRTSALCMALLPAASCQHKELCYNHAEHAPTTRVEVSADYMLDWQYDYKGNTEWSDSDNWHDRFGRPYDELRPSMPGGIRMQVYNEDDTRDVLNLPPGGDIVSLSPGEHAILFYNNDTEYIVFDALHSFPSAKATTRTRTRSSYKGNICTRADGGDVSDETTVAQPDMLYGSYIDRYTAVRDTVVQRLDVTMQPLVFTYLIRYEISAGMEYIALARGALAGMAEGVMLNNGQTSAEEATILYDCTMEDFGAEAVVRSFGVPDFPNGRYETKAPTGYGLNLELLLKNGKILSFDFDVTDQVASQPQGGIIEVGGIEVSKEDGASGGSGFDVSVDGWGEFEDVELPLE